MKSPLFSFTSRIFSRRKCFAVFVSMAMLGLANAETSTKNADSVLAVSAYTFRQPASVEPARNRVELKAPGKVTVTSPVGIRGLKLSLESVGLARSAWIETDGKVSVWKGALTPGKAQEVDLEFPESRSFSFFLAGDSRTTLALERSIAILSDGRQVPLSEAFQPGYEKLPHKPLEVEAFPEPPTVRVDAAAAKQLVEQEWKAQRGDQTVRDAVADELVRCERILDRQGKPSDAPERIQLAKLKAGTPNDLLYTDVRRFKRGLLLADPQLDFSQILCIDNPYVHGSESFHEVRHRNEDAATVGGRLLVLDGLGPDADVRKLAPSGSRAAFWRPDLSCDGKKVLFCMKKEDEPAFHIYEIGLDGTGLRQITRGGYNDLDPVYAPDGSIIFTTTRANQFLRCGGSKFRMFVLARMDADGRNIYFISTNAEADYTPVFMPDGRLLYTRWEYVDREIVRIQSLWTVNPDGTALNAFWGNQSRWPDMLLYARPIPGTRKVLFQAAGHHDVCLGGLGIVDQSEGMNYPDGVYNLTSRVPWGEVGRGPADKPYNPKFSAPACYKAFTTPFPVSRDLLLVSARTGADVLEHDPDPQSFNLYLMDYDGNMELLYQGGFNILHAMPVRKRPVPPQIPSNVQWPGKMTAPDQQAQPAVFYSSDIYEGTTIPRGLVKALRVLEIEPQTYCDGKRSTGGEVKRYFEQGLPPGFWLTGETAVSFVMDDTPKRILGTVPVEEDGSVNFKVPPMRSLYFQLLDERGLCLHTMRSFTHAMPGEVRGCVGCHETRSVAPSPKPSIAVRRAPSEITPPSWGDATVGFPRFVQPVLDRHCVSCHGGQTPKGELDLTHRTENGTLLSWPYVKLVFGNKPGKTLEELRKTSIAGPIFPYATYPNPEWKFPTTDTVVPPMTAMSYRSPLVEIVSSGKHHDVKVSPEEEAMIIAWVDTLCLYLGTEEILQQPDIDPAQYYSDRINKKFTYPPRMRTMPAVHRAFQQDDFQTQDDRLPRDADGQVLPSIYYEGNKRMYRIPKQEDKK